LTLERATATPLKVAPIGDARVRFYLDHHQAIEEWAALRQEANTAIHACLLDLADQLAIDAQTLNDDNIDVRVDTSNSRLPHIAITHRQWHEAAGHTPAAIVVEWSQQPLDNRGELHLYVGVRVGEQRRRDQRLLAELTALGPALRQQLGRPWEREDGAFPVWRWIQHTGPTLDEIAIVQEARTAAWQCWSATAMHIDRLVTAPQ
jgi:hypothetical protein